MHLRRLAISSRSHTNKMNETRGSVASDPLTANQARPRGQKSLISLSKLRELMPQHSNTSLASSQNPTTDSISPFSNIPHLPDQISPRPAAISDQDFRWATKYIPQEARAQLLRSVISPNFDFAPSFFQERPHSLGSQPHQVLKIPKLRQFETTAQNLSLQNIKFDHSRSSEEQANLSLCTIDTLDRQRKRDYFSPPDARPLLTEERAQKEERRAPKGATIKNNMTPSSLLLLQNHNYIEQQQQQQQRANQTSYHGSTSRWERVDVSEQIRGQEDCTISMNPVQMVRSVSNQVTCTNAALSPNSSASHMTSINQFKRLDGHCNTSEGSLSCSATSSMSSNSQNVINSNNYQANQSGLSQPMHDQLSESDIHAGSVGDQIYLNGAVGEVPKNNSLNGHFVNCNTHNFRLADPLYISNSTRVPIPEQHSGLKPEHSGTMVRSVFEDSANMLQTHDTVSPAYSAANVLASGRNPPQHNHSRSGLGQYYRDGYSVMQTPSSKSSASPTSTASTPSPKTNCVTNHNANHYANSNSTIPTIPNSPSSKLSVEHVNHQYMNNNMIVSSSIGQHHPQQVAHSYSYNQQAVGSSSHHHLASMNSDQAYAHQHQHHSHHHHHQQQQQHPHSHHPQQMQAQHSIYQQLANNVANVGANQMYLSNSSSAHYGQSHHAQVSSDIHQQVHMTSGSQHNHLNDAAAACAAAAVVSHTLKSVANQHGQSHYNSNINSGFYSNPSLMNMTPHNGQLHNSNLSHQMSMNSHQTSTNSTSSVVTRKYQCKMCPQVFISKAEMKYHNQNHMREAKPYKCLQCPKAFANSSYLSQHMRIHQGVKPYTCDICSRKFTQLSHLQQHKRTHTGDKPYKCTYLNCTKQFSQLSNLQSHSRCHQLDKPYKCNSCYKCFHDEQSLLEHIPRHLESKHLKKNLCIFCGSSYQQERGLVKHFQQYHTNKSPTLVAAAIAAGTTGNTSLIASLVSSSTSSGAFATPASANGGNSSSSSSSSSISSNGSITGNLNQLGETQTHMSIARGPINC